MIRPWKYLAAFPILILLAGIWKFNVVGDAPYAGDPISYLAENGEQIEAQWKTDGSVEVRFMQAGDDYLKAFLARPAQSASGARYDDINGRFTFWTKGAEATIFHGDEGIFTGQAHREETLYFDPAAREWRDAHGPCLTCTPQNGFGPAGQIAGAPPVVWQNVRLRLLNDLEEEPPASEVQELFATHYSADPTLFGTHVTKQDDHYRIIVATHTGETDFLAQNGALRAWYEIED